MMKKITLLTICLFSVLHFINAQPMPPTAPNGKSCCDAIPLSQPGTTITINNTEGFGFFNEDVSCSCLSGEGGSTWFAFSITASGYFQFMIKPISTHSPNFDWAIWAGSCPCGFSPAGGLPPPPNVAIACSAATGANGPTGMAKEPMLTFGVAPNPEIIQDAVFLEAGRNYYFLISNQPDDGYGFTLDMVSTASIWNPAPPFNGLAISGPTQVCTGGTATFDALFNPSPYPTSFEWSISGPPDYVGIYNPSFNDPFKELTFNTPGSFQVCVRANRPDFGCFPTAPNCLTVTVADAPSPAGYESGSVCLGSEYIAGNGEVFYFGGNFDLHYQNQFGCDSLIKLTLAQKIPDFNITVKEVCPGECVSWGGETYCGAGIYDDVYTNRFGCDSTEELLIVEVPLETNITGVTNLDCNHTSVTLSGSTSIFSTNAVFTWKKGSTVVGTGQTLTVTTGGTYTLTIVNPVGDHSCTESKSVTIIQDTSPPQNVTAVGGSTNCYAPQVTLMGNSTTPGVSYIWTGPSGFYANTQNTTATATGNYTLTVTGTNGCTKTATAVVTENKLAPSASAVANSTINCNASSIQLSGAGSSTGGQFTYSWSTSNGHIAFGGNTLTPTVDAGGTYVLTVTNLDNGCTASATAQVIQFLPVTSQIVSSTSVLCNGGNAGSASVTAAGGNGTYAYQWSNGQTSATATNLTAGTYTVVITDGNGCTSSQTVTISQPASIVPNATATQQTTFGVNDGTASANPSGGTGAYTFAWSNGSTIQTVTGLAPGNYTVIISDANGCTAMQTVVVQPVNCAISASIISDEISCNGATDGQLTFSVTGANGVTSYLWSNGATSAIISDLAAGTYIATATDENGCEIIAQATLTEPTELGATVSNIAEALCGASDGSLTASGTGGTPGYTYLWQTGETTQTLNGLAAGTYTVQVTDAHGCTKSMDFALGTVDAEAPTVATSDITVILDGNGLATISPTDLDNGSSDNCTNITFNLDQSSFDCGNLGDNTVTLSVTDGSNNTATATANVTVLDNTPPVLNLMEITVTIGPNGTVTITPQMLDNGSSDNCGIVTWTLSQEAFGCDQGGANTIEVTATDASGNTSTATVIVNVAGGSAGPAIDCPNNIALPACDPVAEFNVTAVDNCGGGTVTLTQGAGLPSGSSYPVGTTTVSFTATNISGGQSTCSFQVTVAPPMATSATSQNVTCFGENDGSAIASATGGTPPLTYHWSNGDNNPNITGLVAGQYGFTVTDASGCTATGSVAISQPTNLTTTLVNIVNDATGQSLGSVDVTVGGGMSPYTYVWKNLMGTVVGNMEDVSGLPAGTYTLAVTDAHGCQSQSAYTIQGPSATKDSDLDGHLMLYPNPSSGEVTLELTGTPVVGITEVTAYDVTGRQVLHLNSNTNKHILGFNDKPSGVYMLKIVVGAEVITRRLVISR